jgi:DNA-binding MarR family transcriptional regulator
MMDGLTLPTEDRILLYLSNFGSLENVYECDSSLTQKGVAVNVRVQRKHISRYLDRLIEEGFVEEVVRHVKGAKQKMNCYSLTGAGLKRAREIEKCVGEIRVKVRIDGKIQDMKISEIDGATSVHLRISDIICEALESDEVLDMETLETIEEERRRTMDEKSMRAEVYRKALAVAWRSGILTSSEKHLIDALKTHLAITDQEHRNMETVIINDIPQGRITHADIYDEVLNLIDGRPTAREERILEMLKVKLTQEEK